MKKSLFASLIVVAGCAPLQQAPLMYTSKQVLGVDISAPTTESTGVTMNLGFKNVDAAYVPVAVSKEGKAEISLVDAAYGRGDEKGDGSGESDKLQVTRVNNLKNALLGEQTAANNLANITAVYTAANEYNNQLSKDLVQAKSYVSNNSIFSSANFVKYKALIAAGNPIPQEDVESLKNAQDTAQTNYNTTVGALDKAKRELAASLYVTRRDAMSVYGSFGSSTGGDASSISNKLGKMFSTGVAAQNLTEGIAAEGKGLAVGKFLANCIEISKTMDEPQKKKFSGDCARAAVTTD